MIGLGKIHAKAGRSCKHAAMAIGYRHADFKREEKLVNRGFDLGISGRCANGARRRRCRGRRETVQVSMPALPFHRTRREGSRRPQPVRGVWRDCRPARSQFRETVFENDEGIGRCVERRNARQLSRECARTFRKPDELCRRQGRRRSRRSHCLFEVGAIGICRNSVLLHIIYMQ